jgi:hypothetical protein
LKNNDIDSTAKLCLGLYQLAQAVEFLHEKVKIKSLLKSFFIVLIK